MVWNKSETSFTLSSRGSNASAITANATSMQIFNKDPVSTSNLFYFCDNPDSSNYTLSISTIMIDTLKRYCPLFDISPIGLRMNSVNFFLWKFDPTCTSVKSFTVRDATIGAIQANTTVDNLFGFDFNFCDEASNDASKGIKLGNTVNVGTNTANNIPYLIPDLNNVIMIKTGNNHSIALLSDGTIKCWGLNDRGQLGDGTTTNSSSPVTVSGINNAIAIAAGDKHSIALLSDGTIKSWGSNEFNQLGNSTNAGTTTANSSPLSVLNITNAIAIASGSNHCLALLNDNTVRAWGRNTDGQLGNGSTTSSFTPVTVTSLTSVIGISAGDVHSIALRTDGTIRIWGDGTSGKLGNGSTTDSTTIYNPSINGTAKYNLTSDSNYINNNWTAICWNPDLELFAAVSNTGTNNRIILSSNDSILSKETVIKNLNNSFNIDQNNDRIGLNISNPSYQLHLSSSNATKPGTSTWTVSSDIRLKENIEDADLDLCYNNIKNLPLKRYKWKDEYITYENTSDRHKLGWIAQDVETILPKAIIINNQYDIEDCKSLDIDQIIATLYGSIKKLINICELQDSKITELENKKKILNDFINSLEIVQE